MSDAVYLRPRRQSPLPLVMAGVALVMTAYLVWERFGSPPVRSVAPRTITPRGELADFEKVTIAIYEQNEPSVVHITTSSEVRTDYWTSERIEGSGSGFVWDASGLIVTNFHVVGNATQIFVRLHGEHRDRPARVVQVSPEHDIAVVQVVGGSPELRPIQLGDSRQLKVGQSVFAIGNPFGLDSTLTTGVISALNRTIKGVMGNPIEDVIQVDAAINPGNSGGPLLDSAGLLIGMNTAIYSRGGDSAGIGFAVPVHTVRSIVTGLLENGTPGPSLGVRFARQFLRDGREVLECRVVHEGTNAARAGLRGRRPGLVGDLLLELDGQPMTNSADVVRFLDTKHNGEVVTAKVLRVSEDGESFAEQTVPITLH